MLSIVIQVEGAVTVQPLAYPVQGFDEYFLSRTPENNARNPWFIEYWEKQFMCKHPNGSLTPYNEQFNRTCTGKEKYDEEYPYSPEAQLQFVSDAVMAFAYAYKVTSLNGFDLLSQDISRLASGSPQVMGIRPKYNRYAYRQSSPT